MMIDLNSSGNNSPFHYQSEEINYPSSSLLLPRSAWANQVNYLRVLFRVKKRLDQIEWRRNLPEE
jgi:hypothetical protein